MSYPVGSSFVEPWKMHAGARYIDFHTPACSSARGLCLATNEDTEDDDDDDDVVAPSCRSHARRA